MAASGNISDNTVIYKLFCTSNNDGNSNLVQQEALEIIAEDYLSKISGFLQRYIWQNEAFNLRVVDSTISPPYLEGITCFEDNVEDEWFIVYLLFYLSEKDKNLVIQIQDNDGEFLLIEAADYLPKWVNPETSENRVFIYQGALYIIPLAHGPAQVTPLPSGVPSVADAVSVIRQHSSLTKASPSVQEAVKNRINEYPHRIDENKHRAQCYLPSTVAAILKEDPKLLPHAVKAFYLRDPIDLKACRAMKYFAPETRVMTNVTFTRCLYAQLSSQKYEPDKMTGWNLPAENCPERKAHELGMKLACGFEILATNVEKMMHLEKETTEHDFCSDVRWRRFAKSLKDKGYFRAEVEGSQMHSRLLRQAKEFYLTSLGQDGNLNLNPGIRVQKLLGSINVNFEEMKEAEKLLHPADDDSWMDITPEILDSMLEKMSKRPSEASVVKTITDGLTSFVNRRSDFDGVEPQHCPQKTKKQKINFDPDAFADAVNAILDFRIPHSDDDGSSSSMSGYSDDDDDDVDLDEGKQDKYNVGSKGKTLNEMTDYMEEMDRELAKTSIGLSFEKLPPRATLDEEQELNESCDINEEEDDFRPVDIDMTALKNILESYSSQQGLPGPVSNLFASLDMQLPDNADP